MFRDFFLSAQRMLARSLPSTDGCLSVCLSHAGIVCKRLNLSENFLNLGSPIILVVGPLAPILNAKGNPVSGGGWQNTWGGENYRFSIEIAVYLGNGVI